MKLWSCNRLERYAVTLNNNEEDFIAAIIQRGSLKLNIEGTKLVAEDDGTCVTDMEVLQYYITSKIPLVKTLNIKLKDRRFLEAIQSGIVNWQLKMRFPPNETKETLGTKMIILCAMDLQLLQRITEGSEEK